MQPNNKVVSFGVGIELLAFPLLASAQTTITSSNVSLIVVLTQLVQVLEQELQQLVTNESVSLPGRASSSSNSATSTTVCPSGYVLNADAICVEQRQDGSAGSLGYLGPNLGYDICQAANPINDRQGDQSLGLTNGSQVYVADTSGDCFLIPGANPKTFVALDANYGIDADHVWVLGGISNAYTDLVPGQIVGADPKTFTLIAEPNGDYSTVYTKDKIHVYADGQIVEGADPNTFSVYNTVIKTTPEADTWYNPLLGETMHGTVECLADAQDAHSQYYEGDVVTPSDCVGGIE